MYKIKIEDSSGKDVFVAELDADSNLVIALKGAVRDVNSETAVDFADQPKEKIKVTFKLKGQDRMLRLNEIVEKIVAPLKEVYPYADVNVEVSE